MGLPAIVAVMAANAAMSSSLASSRRLGSGGAGVSGEPQVSVNIHAERHREQIIRHAIQAAMPIPFFGWFNICPVNSAQEILNHSSWTTGDAYKLLHAYHCVSWFNIPREIRKEMPALIREALTPQ